MFEFHELFDAKEIDEFCNKVAKQFRNSPEYLIWLNDFTIRDVDAVTGQSSIEDDIDIEVHHYGISLERWIRIIMDKFIENELFVNSHYFCLILSDIHLNRCVPYVPLMHCYHKVQQKIKDEAFLEKYPQITDYIYKGDTSKAMEIIDNHIEILKKISQNEK